MKKLLSLLSVLTISGTAVPTTIAANPYQKEETKLENIFEINNLKNLNRNKRDNNISPELEVSNDEIDKYFSDLYSVINFLQNRNNINLISPQITGGYSYPNVFYLNENNNNQYFILPINIQNSRRISLIFNSTDLYLQGFIGHPTSNGQTLNVYYYFRDATIRNISGVTRAINMNFDSTYTALQGNSNLQTPIRWEGIVNSFNQLANYGEDPDSFNCNVSALDKLKADFIRVILATAESIRFREVRNTIIYNYKNGQTTTWGWFFDKFLKNWDRISTNALNYLISFGTLIGFEYLNDINIFSRTLSNHFQSCKKGRTIDSNNNEYCFILPEKIAYFRVDRGVSEHNVDWKRYTDDYDYVDFSEVEIGDIIPLNYNKIEFFGEQLTKISWGNDAYFGKKIGDTDLGNNFKNYIYNLNIRDYPKSKYIEIAQVSLDDKCEKDGLAWMCHKQKVGITYYQNHKTKKWHIQIISYLSAKAGVTYSGGASWIWIGNGIKIK